MAGKLVKTKKAGVMKTKGRVKVRIIRPGVPKVQKASAKKKVCRFSPPKIRKGSIVVVDGGGLGRLDSVVGPMANVTLDLGEQYGLPLVTIVAADRLMVADSWEKKLHRAVVKQLQAAYNRGYHRGLESGLGRLLAPEQAGASEDEALEVVRQVQKGDRR